MSEKLPEDEIKFSELLKNPKRLFGFSFVYFLLILVIAGIFYVKNIDEISYNAVPISYIDSLNIERDIPQKEGGIMPAVNLDAVKTPDDAMLTKGKELYEANCSSCHGSGGQGNGPAGVALNPAPRNFLEVEGWTNSRDITGLYKTLQEGILQNGMAAYEYLPPEDRFAIIHYVRSFADFPEVTDQQMQNLDALYNLSAGVIVPNQIPVSRSVKIIESEFEKTLNSPEFENYILLNRESKGAQLLNNYSLNSENIIEISVRGEISSSLNEFITSVSLAPMDFGFKSSIVGINADQWQSLHIYLIGFANLNNS
jgi:mono/diheme cytochrome c family protein